MPPTETYSTTAKAFFWIFWLLGLFLTLIYLILLPVLTDLGGKQDTVMWLLIGLLLIAIAAQIGVMIFTLKHFMHQSWPESKLLLLLAGIVVGMPFVLFAGCISMLGAAG